MKKNLYKRYVISLLSLFVVVVCTAITVTYFINLQSDDALTVNIAGRQRMYSQKISKIALEYQNSNYQDEALALQLRSTTEAWREAQESLQNQDSRSPFQPPLSQRVKGKFENINPDFTTIKKAAFALSEDDSNQDFLVNVILRTEDSYLNQMNDIVFTFQEEAEGKLEITQTIIILVTVLVVSMIILVWLTVIHPTLKQGKRLEKAKDDIITLSSHQLQKPVTMTITEIQSLQKELEKKEHVNLTEHILERLYGMNTTINLLLKVSEQNLAEISNDSKKVNVYTAVQSSVSHKSELAKIKSIKVINRVEKDIGFVLGNTSIIRLIIENLIDNALQYSDNYEEINIYGTHSKRWIHITIEDFGFGISEVNKEKIFDKMFRSKKALRYHPYGNGLSLYLSEKLAKQLGGNIDFKSEEGIGSRFTLKLPRLRK